MSPVSSTRIEKTAWTCDGDARIANTRIPVWLLVLHRKSGQDDQQVLASYPTLSLADLDAAWVFYRDNPVEIEQSIWLNDTAANVPDRSPVPAAVIVAGRLLGLEDVAIREAFDPPLSETDDLPPLPHVQPLSNEDRDLFLSILDNPPEPNAALRKLMSGGEPQPAG